MVFQFHPLRIHLQHLILRYVIYYINQFSSHWYRVDFVNFQLLMNREWRFYLLCWKILFSYPPQPLSRQTQRRSSQFQKDQNGFIYSKENMPLLILHLSRYATFSPFVISIIISKVTIMFFLQRFIRDDAC
jgi:hypothetical protein